MMRHLDEGALQALLDEELSEAEAREARVHLAECASCAAALDESAVAVSTLASAISLLDVPVRRVGAPKSRPGTMRRRMGWGAGALGRAAVLLLSVGAVASATIPGSPVREWLGARLQPQDQQVAIEAAPAASPAAAPMAEAAAAEYGLSAEPLDGRFRVALSGASPGLEVRAILTDSRRGGVYVVAGTDETRFRGVPGMVEAFDAGSGQLRVEIPRSAGTAVVEIDGRTYLVKDGDQLRLVLPERESAGTEIVFQVGS